MGKRGRPSTPSRGKVIQVETVPRSRKIGEQGGANLPELFGEDLLAVGAFVAHLFGEGEGEGPVLVLFDRIFPIPDREGRIFRDLFAGSQYLFSSVVADCDMEAE